MNVSQVLLVSRVGRGSSVLAFDALADVDGVPEVHVLSVC